MTYAGRWHGERRYFGLHYDLHAGADDTELGARCAPRELVPLLKLMAPDFVQTDCKGHPGYTSWFSQVPAASVSPGVVKDALQQWRAATRRLGLPLHCHYSGIWDKAAGAKHPEWCVQTAAGEKAGAPFGADAGKATGEKMCPRGPYLDELMIPQLRELIDRYAVDGFWIDGDLWAVEPCYCVRCTAAYGAQTGGAAPPAKETDPDWPRWWAFTLAGYEEYVTRYCDAVHRHKPGVLVCANWLQTFRHPGEPKVPTDWISGDNSWIWGMDGSRCEARFISTRGKPWDIMLWTFYCSHGMGQPESAWTAKPADMLKQEAAVTLALGGNVQLYEHPPGLRNGQLVPWRMRRWGEVGRFVKARRRLCQDTGSLPQVAVLHSEHHARAGVHGKNLMWSLDTAPVQGAVFALLENHYGVDILDEWALRPRLADFPVVVAPEQDRMSDEMVAALRHYVAGGGRLLVSGAAAFDRFGADFFGVTTGKLAEKAVYYVPVGADATPLYSAQWRLVEAAAARAYGRLGLTPLRAERLLPHPAFVVNRVGKGAVAYMPAAVFRDFAHNRYPAIREFIGELTAVLAGRLEITVQAPVCVDVVLRRKGSRRILHFINRASGIPNLPNSAVIDEIPRVGPVRISLAAARKPRRVRVAGEKGELRWDYRQKARGGRLDIRLRDVRIHAMVVVE
jgi:hypothetical protein